MTYLRSLFLNFLVVFFVAHSIPGIEVKTYENVPNIGADIIFAVIVGFLNASIFPALVIIGKGVSLGMIALISAIICIVSFFLIGIIDFGVHVSTFWGGFIGALIVWLVSLFANYLEMRHSYRPKK